MESTEDVRWFWGRPLPSGLVLGTVIAAGLAYVLVEWQETRAVADSLFVGLLLGATLTLYQGMRVFHRHLVATSPGLFAELEDWPRHKYDAASYVRQIYSAPRMALCGLGWGILLTVAPFALDVWPTEPTVRIGLAGFLFTVAFVTGLSLYSLVRFFVLSHEIGSHIPVDLWDRSSRAARIMMTSSHKVAIVAALYVCLCVVAIGLSVFPLGAMTIGYASFAFLVIVAAVVIPMIPIRNRLAGQRSELMDEISHSIQQEFAGLLAAAKQPTASIDLDRYNQLLAMRDSLGQVHTLPFGAKFVQTAVSVFGLTTLPAILQMILEKTG